MIENKPISEEYVFDDDIILGESERTSNCTDLSFHGPFGNELMELERINVLACFLGGIGITGGSQLIFDCIEHFPQTKVYIFWSIRTSDYLELTLFKGICCLI
jgi:NAD(P)H-flavin reductase